jgi:hypothetical protein
MAMRGKPASAMPVTATTANAAMVHLVTREGRLARGFRGMTLSRPIVGVAGNPVAGATAGDGTAA